MTVGKSQPTVHCPGQLEPSRDYIFPHDVKAQAPEAFAVGPQLFLAFTQPFPFKEGPGLKQLPLVE